MSIEEAVAEAVSEQVEEAISNLDMSVEIAQGVEEAIEMYNFDSIVSDSIDYDDIRYNIEDDILNQVNDHIDPDYLNFDSSIQSVVERFIWRGCSEMDAAADKIVQRSMGGSNDWFIPTVTEWNQALGQVGDQSATLTQSRITELEATVARLLEVISLPEVKAPVHILSDTINSGELSLSIAQDVLDQIRQERYQTIRYMSKPELVAWATENDYDVDGMTVARIHELVL